MARKKLTVNVTEEELQLWKHASHRSLLTLSSWVRNTLNNQAQSRTSVTVLDFDAGTATQQPSFSTTATVGTREGIGTPPNAEGLPPDATKGKTDSRRKPRTKPCEHRLPPEVFCKTCDT